MARKKTTPSKKPKTKRTRTIRPFPSCSFEDALELPNAIQRSAGNQSIRRLTLFDELEKAPESGPSRQLIVNASRYGLITGGYQSDLLQLTEDGDFVTSDEASPRDKARAIANLAVLNIAPFNTLYERYVNNKLPSRAVVADAFRELEIPAATIDEAVDTFVVNCQFAKLLQTLSGAERFVSIEHLLDSLPASAGGAIQPHSRTKVDGKLITQSAANFATTCFYVTPIGKEGSEHRKHSDLFLGSIVEPALEQFDISVVRADAIEKPGLITKQVIEYLLKSRLVIADLSFHNPNVFYELAIRHAARLPTVQIIRAQDRIPFDVNQNRTIQIDCTDIYSLVPQIETYKSRIANQVRRALDDADASDNPITLYWPSLKVEL